MGAFRISREHPLVLVVDDDSAIRRQVRTTLEQSGFTVEEEAGGNGAVAAFTRLKPDMVMLGIELPGTDGIAVCSAIRSLSEGYATPIIMMAGPGDNGAVSRAYDAGATDFVTKPLNCCILSHRVKHILHSSNAFESLLLSEGRLAEAQRIAKIGFWEVNRLSGELNVSDEACRLLGMAPVGPGVSREIFREKRNSCEEDTAMASLLEAVSEGTSFSLDHAISRPNGNFRYIHAEAQVVKDDLGRPVWTVGYIQDTTESRLAEEKIRHLAYFDSVTGLPNRTLFKDYFSHAMALAERINCLLAVLFIDLDRFKQINDTLGHTIGDELLKQVAERLVLCVRKCDYISRDIGCEPEQKIARFAGDEFLILLENINDYNEAAKVAKRISTALSAPFQIGGHEIAVSASIGISLYPFDGECLDEVIKKADIAMYHAKAMGKSNFQFYTDSINTAAMTHLVMENHLRKAVRNDELFLLYQPMVDMHSRRIFGVEVLVRWQNPELGVVPPAQFIPLAEETGLIAGIDEWVLHAACSQISNWRKYELPSFKLSVNISAYHFRKKNLLDIVDRVLQRTEIDPEFLELELTEGVLINNDQYTMDTLRSLKKRGIMISLDDFGTGYSSLSYLKRFPIDVLKIDQSFVKDIFDDADSASITSAIIAMSQSLKLETVAEGVETKEQMNLLLEKGCTKMQGYLFSPPLSAVEFENLLAGYSVP